MAEVGTQTDLVVPISLEEEKLFQKRVLSNNPDWKPVNDGDHGAGLIPEDLWKRDYSPESQERTAI